MINAFSCSSQEARRSILLEARPDLFSTAGVAQEAMIEHHCRQLREDEHAVLEVRWDEYRNPHCNLWDGKCDFADRCKELCGIA
ncbi:hypothetical protein KKF55_03690 [Patescibacteria group bacterium]|nr:hypothetical protein [Patescibacteria group bacterium]